MSITLNKTLDAKKLAASFAKTKRLQIPNFLAPAAAENIHTILVQKTVWLLTFNDGDKTVWKDVKEFKTIVGRRLRTMINTIYGNATAGRFQYFRYARGLDEDPLNIRPLNPGLTEMLQFLDSKTMTGFLTALTGKAVKDAATEAQWYRNDNFQTTGTGEVKGQKRVLGFALNLSKNWNADWGGNTLFSDAGGKIVETYVPQFNSLEVFEVPTAHSVSSVTGFAGEFRLSIAGYY